MFYLVIAIWSYKGVALVSHKNFCRLEKSACHLMKTILSDADLCEEHDETKYSPIGLATAELWTLCAWMWAKPQKTNEN